MRLSHNVATTCRPVGTYQCRSVQPFVNLHVVNTDAAVVDAFEVDLLLVDHVDQRILEDAFLIPDLHQHHAFRQFDRDINPCIQRQRQVVDGDDLLILLQR